MISAVVVCVTALIILGLAALAASVICISKKRKKFTIHRTDSECHRLMKRGMILKGISMLSVQYNLHHYCNNTIVLFN